MHEAIPPLPNTSSWRDAQLITGAVPEHNAMKLEVKLRAFLTSAIDGSEW
jgi:hypothetical protein